MLGRIIGQARRLIEGSTADGDLERAEQLIYRANGELRVSWRNACNVS